VYKFRKVDIFRSGKQKFIDCYNTIFPSVQMTRQWFDWYYVWNCDSKVSVYGVFDSDNLIGIWCLHSCDLNIPIKIARGFAMGIHPSYRKQGLFHELTQFVFKSEKRKKKYDLLIGLPRKTNPILKNHLKAGWEVLCEIPQYEIFDITQMSQNKYWFDDLELDDYWENSYIPKWDKKILAYKYDWDKRYYHPEQKYWICYYKNESNCVALKPYGDTLHILDMNAQDVNDLLICVKNLAFRQKFSKITAWCHESDMFLVDLIRNGFIKSNDVRVMVKYDLSDTPFSFDNYNLQAIHIPNVIEEMY